MTTAEFPAHQNHLAMKNQVVHQSTKIVSTRRAFTHALLLTLLLAAGLARAAVAADAATGKITSTTLADGTFQYTIVLTNTGTNNLGTFWYAWLPGEDFMPVSPTAIVSPAGWTAKITGGNPNNGFAIQWVATASASPAPLAPSAALSFGFTSTASPETIAGDSPFYATTLIDTSMVYGGAPFADAGAEFEVDSDLVPFFDGEQSLGNDVNYLAFANGNVFGFYSFLDDPHYIYHQDLGFEYIFDAGDDAHGVYFYDFASQGFFYTSPTFGFPYMYDFNLQSVVYFFPDDTRPGHYTNIGGVRYFYDFATGEVVGK